MESGRIKMYQQRMVIWLKFNWGDLVIDTATHVSATSGNIIFTSTVFGVPASLKNIWLNYGGCIVVKRAHLYTGNTLECTSASFVIELKGTHSYANTGIINIEASNLVWDTTLYGIRTNVNGPTATGNVIWIHPTWNNGTITINDRSSVTTTNGGYLHLYGGDIVIGTTSATVNASKSTIIISERCSLTTSLVSCI